MASLVLDIDAGALPDGIAVPPGYDSAVILFRFHERPIDRVNMPVRDGRITRAELDAALSPQARYRCSELLVREMLDWHERPAPRRLPSSTVAICTRNRPDDLRRCLEGVARLHDDGQEVLVIDNCPSNDDSEEVVRSFPGVRYAREPLPGLNHARNRALKEAHGEIVAFIDDDATPDPSWLRALLPNFSQPIVMCVTGLTMPLELEAPAQIQFESYSTFSRGFYRQTFSGAWQDPLACGNIGSGTNMSVRREILTLFGGFDNALDAGSATQSGGDHEMFSRLLIAGHRIVYEPAALNWHRHRRTYAELEKTIHGYGVGAYSALLRALLVEHEWGALRVAWRWFYHAQSRNLWRALRRRQGAQPLGLVLAELRGCARAPFAYWKSIRRLRAMGSQRHA